VAVVGRHQVWSIGAFARQYKYYPDLDPMGSMGSKQTEMKMVVLRNTWFVAL